MSVSAEKNYYKILGVSRDATPAQIKTAYRRLARRFHPDLNPKKRSAGDRFKEVQEAYEALTSQQTEAPFDPPSESVDLEATEDWIYETPRLEFDWNWRRKLSLAVWLTCVLCVFLPTSFLNEKPAAGILVVTFPLVLVWFGDWLADDDEFDMCGGSMVSGVFGKVLMLIGALIFVRLLGVQIIAPLVLWMG